MGGRWTAGIPTNPIKSQLFWCEKTWATGFPDCFHPHPHLPHVSYWLSMVTLELFWLGAVSEWRITGIFLAANVPTFSDKAWLYSLYLPKISQSIPGILVSVQVWTNNPWCQSHPQLVPALLSQQIEKRWVWKWGIPKSSIIHFLGILVYPTSRHAHTSMSREWFCGRSVHSGVMSLPFQSHCWHCVQRPDSRRGDFWSGSEGGLLHAENWLGGFHGNGVPRFIRENPFKIDDLGYAPFMETPIWLELLCWKISWQFLRGVWWYVKLVSIQQGLEHAGAVLCLSQLPQPFSRIVDASI